MSSRPARRPTLVTALIVSLLIGLAACTGAPEEEATLPDESSAESVMFATLGDRLDRLEGKLTDLLGAFSEEDLAWRPMEGTRSVSEIFLHVGADNFYMPIRMLDTPAPESTGITADWATAVAFEERDLTRAEIGAALTASFAHLRTAMEATAGDLDGELTLGQNTSTLGQVWVGIVTHLHEHLGQSIAYARTNQIVPPWSQ